MKKILIFLLLTTVAQAVTVKQSLNLTAFSGGEMSPLLNARSDYPKYKIGAKTLENMLVRSQGPVQRRPGTRYIASVKTAADATRLIGFEYSTDDAYIIEFGDEYARFYRTASGSSGQIVTSYSAWTTTTAYLVGNLVTNSGSYYRCLEAHTSGTFATDLSSGYWVVSGGATDLAYEIVTPWDKTDLFELQFAQDAQYMRVVHPDYDPYKITRTGHAIWTCTIITFDAGPFTAQNDDTALTLTADALTGAGVNLTAASAVFDSDHVGALFQLEHMIEAESVTGYFWADGFTEKFYDWGNTGAGHVTTQVTPTVTVQEGREYSFSTHGQWYGTIKAQRSYDAGSTWEDATPAQAYNADGNVQWSGIEEEDDAVYRLYFEITESVAQECHINLSAHQFRNRGVIEITTVTNSTTAVGTVRTDYDLGGTTATYKWSEGAWSTYRGFPRTVEHHEGRCVYGGSTSYPQTIWASIIADEDEEYDEFDEDDGDNEADAWIYILPGMSPIQWMTSQEYLMIGTTAGIGRLGQPDKPINPTFSPTYRLQAKNGSAYIQAVPAVDAILYVERGARKIREVTFTALNERYVAPDMTILAEHISEQNDITSIAFQNRPDPILWCIRDDGVLLSFTYNRHHEVMSWSRHDTGASGEFESVAQMPGASGEDELWVVAKRTVNSSTVRYIEQFAPMAFPSDQNDCIFVDSMVDDITNLSHLEGESVALFADGRPVSGTFTVSSGEISPTDTYTNYIVGLPYTSVLETLPLVTYTNRGASTARPVTVTKVALDLYKTLGVSVGTSASYISDLQEFSYDSFATTSEAYTGLMLASYPRGTFDLTQPTIYFEVDEPVPFTLRGLTVDLSVVYP
jgi:hypothetical protein